MMTPSELQALFKTAHRNLHRLWTKAVGTDSYVKAEWRDLATAVEQLAREVSKTIGHDGPLL